MRARVSLTVLLPGADAEEVNVVVEQLESDASLHAAALRACDAHQQSCGQATLSEPFVLSTERAASEGSAVHIGATLPQSTRNEGLFLVPSSVLQRDGALEDARPALYIHEACAAQDLSTWSGVLDMPGLPQLWSWSGKVQNGSDRWVPVSCAYPPRHLPSDMPLAAAQWLCPPAHLPEAVARAFGTASGAPVVPHRLAMRTPHDYLELSFEDYFGQWDPTAQQLLPAIRHRSPKRCDRAFSRSALLSRLLNGGFQDLSEDAFAGVGALWLQVDADQHRQFVALLRQSHVMPFVPLQPHSGSGGGAETFAVLQPIDGIAPSALACFAAAHERRAAHVGWGSAEHSPESSGTEALRPHDPRKAADAPLDQAAAMVWRAPEAQQSSEEERITGFIVHVVCLEDIMTWQHGVLTGARAVAAPPQPLDVSVGPATPPPPRLRSLGLACDIDHTLINQTLTVLPRTLGDRYPGQFPPWGRRNAPPGDPIAASDELLAYMEANAPLLHVTGITDDKRWPETALALGPDPTDRPRAHDLMQDCVAALAKILRARRALVVISRDQRFTAPTVEEGGLAPGGPLLHAAAPHTFHMNIILPRRDLLLLIARCCPAGGAAAARPLKPLFTTAAAQLYAESVVDGLKALCALWLAEPDPADRQFCEQSGVRGAEQLAAFFDCPVISTMYHHNLGPDDDTLLLPGTQERPSKALGKGWLFGTHRPEATLHALTWRLSRTALLVLDDTAPVWRECDQPLLLLIRRAPALRELPSVDGLTYLSQLADRFNGGDCKEDSRGQVVRNRTSELDRASARMHNVVEYARGGHAPDEVDALLRLSVHEWSRLREAQRDAQLSREWWRGRELALQGELARRQKRVAELEAEVAALKRLRAGQPNVGTAVLS